jgi:hypothetical protein
MILKTKTKQELVRALGQTEVTFLEEIEVVNDSGLKALTDKAKALLAKNKKIHAVLVERE